VFVVIVVGVCPSKWLELISLTFRLKTRSGGSLLIALFRVALWRGLSENLVGKVSFKNAKFGFKTQFWEHVVKNNILRSHSFICRKFAIVCQKSVGKCNFRPCMRFQPTTPLDLLQDTIEFLTEFCRPSADFFG